MKFDWKFALWILLGGLAVVGFLAAVIAACCERFVLAAVFALMTVVLLAVDAGLYGGEIDG